MKKETQICFEVASVSRDELEKIETALQDAGYHSCETVDLLNEYDYRFYGIDHDGDAIFYDNVKSYGEDAVRVSAAEFLKRTIDENRTGKETQICMSVSGVSKERLTVIEGYLKDAGYAIFESVDSMYDIYCDDYYGIDDDGDVIFYSNSEAYGENAELVSECEFLSRVAEVTEDVKESVPEPKESIVLYKVVTHTGDTLLYNGMDIVREVLRSSESNKYSLASFVFNSNGKMISDQMGLSDLGMMMTDFDIRDL